MNGDFSSGVPSPWVLFGTITSQVAGVSSLEFLRDSSAPPAGAALQLTGQPVAANEIVTATFDLGNSSTVRKRVTVLLHDSNFTGSVRMHVLAGAGQPLLPYPMRTFATQAWANATVSFYAATVDAEAWTRLDNVTFRRTPSAPTFGTDCVEPPAGSLAQGAAMQMLFCDRISGRRGDVRFCVDGHSPRRKHRTGGLARFRRAGHR